MQLTFLASALFAALGATQPGEPWPGPWVVVNTTDMYDESRLLRAPDKGPPIDICTSTNISPARRYNTGMLTRFGTRSTASDEVRVHSVSRGGFMRHYGEGQLLGAYHGRRYFPGETEGGVTAILTL